MNLVVHHFFLQFESKKTDPICWPGETVGGLSVRAHQTRDARHAGEKKACRVDHPTGFFLA
ncbi:hypothetical protein [Variovorax sp. GB1P17]|uniref:hypothetical protein n=1 Tax=Variovorax sp. GB1P17 TaxID=3443740 RepID=UPI003F453F5F